MSLDWRLTHTRYFCLSTCWRCGRRTASSWPCWPGRPARAWGRARSPTSAGPPPQRAAQPRTWQYSIDNLMKISRIFDSENCYINRHGVFLILSWHSLIFAYIHKMYNCQAILMFMTSTINYISISGMSKLSDPACMVNSQHAEDEDLWRSSYLMCCLCVQTHWAAVGVSLVSLEVGLGVRCVRDVRVAAAGGARHGHLEGVGAGRHQADAAHARDGRGEAHRRKTET